MRKTIGNFIVVFTTLFFFSYLLPVQAQISEKLPANTLIGTELSVDYDTDLSSTTVNTKANAFDGKLNTFFASYERSGTWVGLDLGERFIITKIKYAPRLYVNGPQRLQLGVFEGANNPDFSDAIPLYIITKIPPVKELTEQEINCSRGFRYVRYVGPNDQRCNIAEIEFYGYKGTGTNSFFPQLTNLPTIVISTAQAAEIDDREVYIPGFISVINNGKIYSDMLEIRGRGHGSWTHPKKPYRIKLRNKTNLLGLPASERSWTLINNYGDKTLMRNLLSFDLSRRFDMTYTVAAIPVDVIVNGEYKGCYQLCDQIEVAPGRVDIQQIAAKDVVLPNLSGGYLLELDAYATLEEENWFYSSRHRTPVKIRSPKEDEIVTQQYFYIQNHYQKMEEALSAINYSDPVLGYRKYLNLESFIRYFLIGEISGNTDHYWSVYLYKERNNDQFKFGPVWDSDLAYDNDSRFYPVNSHSTWLWERSNTAAGVKTLVRKMFSDESFVTQLTDTYIDYRTRGILTKESFMRTIDDYALLINQSQALNFIRWPILDKRVHLNPVALYCYEAEVDNVKRYISERIDWLDNKLGYIPDGNTFIQANLPDVGVYARDNILFFDRIASLVTISIADMTGRIIFSTTIAENTSISVSKGVYFITISDAAGNSKTVKQVV